MKRRVLLIAGVGVLGGCLQNGEENTQGSDGTDQEEEDDNGTDQENESNGTAEEPDSNTMDQDNTANGTDQDDSTNGSDHTNDSPETKQTDTSNGTTQDNVTNGSAQEADGNGTSDFGRVVSLSDVDDIPSEFNGEFNINILNNSIRSDETSTIEISTKNTSDDREEFQMPYYKGASSEEGEPGILIYSLKSPDAPDDDYTPECIDDPSSTEDHIDWTTEEPPTYDLQANESTTDEFIIVDDPTIDGCFPTGNYKFENGFGFGNSGEETFTWSFELEITDDE